MKRIIFLSLIPLFLVNNVVANNKKEHIDINAVWSEANYGGPFLLLFTH